MNVAIDEAMFRITKENSLPIIRIWEQENTALVIGRSQEIIRETNYQQCINDEIPIVRRCSAGGTVIQKRGSINFVFSFPTKWHPDLKDVKKSFYHFASIIIQALKTQNIISQYRLLSDITTNDGKKLSGNAQARNPTTVMHHGTLLVTSCHNEMTKYLAHPSKEPEYRKARLHENFVTSIEELGLKMDKELLGTSIKDQFKDAEIKHQLPNNISDLAKKLYQEKYKLNNWNEYGKLI